MNIQAKDLHINNINIKNAIEILINQVALFNHSN